MEDSIGPVVVATGFGFWLKVSYESKIEDSMLAETDDEVDFAFDFSGGAPNASKIDDSMLPLFADDEGIVCGDVACAFDFTGGTPNESKIYDSILPLLTDDDGTDCCFN